MKKISLNKFLIMILKGRKIKHTVIVNDSSEDKVFLESLCDLSLGFKRLNEVWSWIIHDINEAYYPLDVTNIFNDKILTFLVNNNIALNSLGHLQLTNKWLNEIYKKDGNCFEAMQTIEKRKVEDLNKVL